MGKIIFLIIAVVSIPITVYLTMKSKIRCPNCKSSDVIKTGNKMYKEEPPLAAYGSPDSYHTFEYKCPKCGSIFWKEQKAIVFN